jgi:hypothetical protein
MGLIGVQNHRVPVLERKFLPRNVPAGRQEPSGRRLRRHRQDDVVHKLWMPPTAALHVVPIVLQGIKIEIPVFDELRRHPLAHQPLTVIRLDLKVPLDDRCIENALRRLASC